METLVHFPLVSGSHCIVHVEPAWKVSPGPGAVGVNSARDMAERDTKVKMIESIAGRRRRVDSD